MKRKEAYSILEIPETSSSEEAKKKYRELTKKYHPDINKDPGANDKFKKINEAYQAVSKNTFDEDRPTQRQQRYDWNAGFQQIQQPQNIDVHTTISFKESVLGCKKDLKFSRKTKCNSCNGHGETHKNNGCDKCGGRGQTVTQQGGMVMIQTCDKCYGRMEAIPCTVCKTEGTLEAEASINVSIPGGVQTGNILRLNGMGHFAGMFMGQIEQHTDVHLYLTITPEEGLLLNGNDVVCNLEISLLEALAGCTKTVKTVLGDKKVDIKPKSRNKDEVIIPRVGVNGRGNQRVVLDVQYPTDISKIINVLDERKA